METVEAIDRVQAVITRVPHSLLDKNSKAGDGSGANADELEDILANGQAQNAELVKVCGNLIAWSLEICVQLRSVPVLWCVCLKTSAKIYILFQEKAD